MNEYKGYSLFNDVEDKDVQIYNRARILVNIMEDHSVGTGISGTGAMICTGYFLSIPEDERADVHSKAAALLFEKGLRK